MSETWPGVGRWLVEIRENGGRTAARISEDERAHGGSGPDLHIPGLNAWFEAGEEATRRNIAEMLADED